MRCSVLWVWAFTAARFVSRQRLLLETVPAPTGGEIKILVFFSKGVIRYELTGHSCRRGPITAYINMALLIYVEQLRTVNVAHCIWWYT
jgi:hypothetical protein